MDSWKSFALMVLGGAAMFSGGLVALGEKSPAPQFEYKRVASSALGMQGDLDKAAGDGWRLVQAVETRGGLVLIFERAK
jgi:hypothetical protein